MKLDDRSVKLPCTSIRYLIVSPSMTDVTQKAKYPTFLHNEVNQKCILRFMG